MQSPYIYKSKCKIPEIVTAFRIIVLSNTPLKHLENNIASATSLYCIS